MGSRFGELTDVATHAELDAERRGAEGAPALVVDVDAQEPLPRLRIILAR